MHDIIAFVNNHLTLVYSLAIAMLLLAIIETMRASKQSYNIDTKQAVQLINRKHAVVVDIRNKDEFLEKHIIDAKNMQESELASGSNKLNKWKTKPIIVVCKTGVGSQKIAARLVKEGYNVFALSGGMNAWASAGLPITKGSK